MPDQYTVPQFIDVEDKIFGPITTRQFIILLVTGGLIFITYRLSDFGLFILLGLAWAALGGTLAFVRVNGQPFHFFLLNLIQTNRRSPLRVWNKELPDRVLQAILAIPPPPPSKPKIVKEAMVRNKLAELTLIVNTGGVYKGEE